MTDRRDLQIGRSLVLKYAAPFPPSLGKMYSLLNNY